VVCRWFAQTRADLQPSAGKDASLGSKVHERFALTVPPNKGSLSIQGVIFSRLRRAYLAATDKAGWWLRRWFARMHADQLAKVES